MIHKPQVDLMRLKKLFFIRQMLLELFRRFSFFLHLRMSELLKTGGGLETRHPVISVIIRHTSHKKDVILMRSHEPLEAVSLPRRRLEVWSDVLLVHSRIFIILHVRQRVRDRTACLRHIVLYGDTDTMNREENDRLLQLDVQIPETQNPFKTS